jgi:hypothetical protein
MPMTPEHILLNVGLARKGQPDLSVVDVLLALEGHGVTVFRHVVHQSATEATVVAAVELPRAPDERHAAAHGDLGAIYRSAQQLDQDCIAVYDESIKQGILVGPKAAQWGDFNPTYFLNLEGEFLA